MPDTDRIRTEPVPATEPPADSERPGRVVDPSAGIHPEDPDDDWTRGPVRTGIRLGVPTVVLATLLVLAAGFWGGAVAEKHHNPSTSSQLAALAGRLQSSRSSATGNGASGGGGGGGLRASGGMATAGIVTGVQGDTLYVTASDGTLVKVTPAPSAVIERTATTALAGLATGDTVVVAGTRHGDGTVTATAIRASAQGVTGAGRAKPSAPSATGGP